MERVSYLSVIILLASLLVIREGVKIEGLKVVGCSYTKNILIDSNLYTYQSLVCNQTLYIFISFLSFSFLFILSLVFKILGDQRVFYYFFLFSVFFLIYDVLAFYKVRINYLTLFFIFLLSIPSIALIK